MFNLSLSISNPWTREYTTTAKNYFCRSGDVKFSHPKLAVLNTLLQHKHWEVQCSKMGNELLSGRNLARVDVDLSWSGHDHAGLSITLSLFNFYFCAQVYDSRHWDYDNGTWQTHEANEGPEAYGA